MKKIVFVSFFLFFLQQVFAADSFKLITDNTAAKLYYDGNDQVVNTALDMLINDSKLICKNPFERINKVDGRTIVVGIPNNKPAFDLLLGQNKIDYKDISGKWEAYKIVATDNELFVIGSDPRGAAYGVLELSRRMGVTPWVWWADVVPEKKAELTIAAEGSVHAPSVQYRGIFLNDEDWALMPWATRTFEPTPQSGAIGPKTYAKVFELLLRLRANTLWPAMHECTVPFFMVEGNKEMAKKYGIVISNSHAEPMLRTNTGEWDSKKRGPFNFLTNEKQVLSYWEERVKETVDSENIYTVGMRGIHDGRMQGVKTLDDETGVLRRVIKEQRDMLQRNNPDKDISQIPQQFVPYKEVLKAYDNGLELPEDITLVWCDDNHGYIMRLSDAEEQKRSGGGGVYYHISYYGKPHDYLWLATTQPGLIYAEMKRAWDNNARRLWVLNVGDIKPGEYLTEFFLDMAWDINAFAGDKIYSHQQNWIKQTFGNAANGEIDHILRQFYHLAGHRKPDHMAFNQVEDWSMRKKENNTYIEHHGLQPVKDTEFSPSVFGDEIERRIHAYNEIAELSTKIYETEIPNQLKPAYFQLVHYPVAACAAQNRKILYAQKSRLYASQDVELAAYYAREATNAYNEIAALDYTYNKDMLNGKWDLMMDMKPRDLPVYQQPVLPKLPENILNKKNHKVTLPEVPALVATAGSSMEGDRMIALNASDYKNNISFETIESLGHSNKVVRLPKAKKIDPKQPHLEYKVTTTSAGSAKIKVGIIPQHSAHGNTQMRYAVIIDKQKPVIISTRADFLTSKWTENTLRNQGLTITEVNIPEPGEHTIHIYALDEEMLFDQLMLDFDLDRKHYLIPSKHNNIR